jgi:GTP-binding protein LepA
MGEIGYITTNLKNIHQVQVGDTIMDKTSSSNPLPGYQKVKPMVFASIFPTDSTDFQNLSKALDKLSLNDSSLQFSPVVSKALGAGFRVGFLGLLHAEVIRERLEREFNLSLVLTPPQIEFEIKNNNFFEPYAKVLIITPTNFLSEIIQLCLNHRANFLHMDNLGKDSLQLIYEMPLTELVSDFFDKLKTISSGFASLDWEILDYRPVVAGKLKILLNGESIEEFTEIIAKEKAYDRGQFLVEKLKQLIPRQQFEVKIQASYEGKIIAASRIAPIRKNVLVKSGKVLGTGDISRKRKLLEKQKEGKKRMKMIGKIEVPKEVFLKLFRQ